MKKTGCCRAEQVLDRIDSQKRQDAVEQSRAIPGKNRFLEKRGCCRAEQIRDRIDSWKREDVVEQILDRTDL